MRISKDNMKCRLTITATGREVWCLPLWCVTRHYMWCIGWEHLNKCIEMFTSIFMPSKSRCWRVVYGPHFSTNLFKLGPSAELNSETGVNFLDHRWAIWAQQPHPLKILLFIKKWLLLIDYFHLQHK